MGRIDWEKEAKNLKHKMWRMSDEDEAKLISEALQSAYKAGMIRASEIVSDYISNHYEYEDGQATPKSIAEMIVKEAEGESK